jgi:hypothetical protein
MISRIPPTDYFTPVCSVALRLAQVCSILFVPVYTRPSSVPLSAINAGGVLNFSFPTQPGYGCQVECKINLTGATWLPLGGIISGNGSTQTVNDAGGTTRF